MSSTHSQFQPPDAEQMRVHRPMASDTTDSQQAEVERIEVNGRDYLVFPLIAAREMVLDYPENGTSELLPARHLQESVSLWDGTPITFIHPENERRTADDPREYTQTIIGQAYQPKIKDKEKLQVMAYIDVDKARDFGGLAETVVDKLAAGDDLGVSAGYATLNDDRSGGNYNGTQYDVEQGYIIPDHIAVFPNEEFTARCDWEDGCGAPRVNYTVKQNELSEARRPTFDGLTSAEWNPPSFTDYMEQWYADHEPDLPDNVTVNTVREQAKEWAARRTLVGDPDGDSADAVISFPVVNLDGELNENALTASRNLAFNSDAQDSIMEVSANLLENAPENNGDWPSGASYNFNRENHSKGRPYNDQHKDKFEEESDAEARAVELGCSGTHQHEDGRFMPCDSHPQYEEAVKAQRENRVSACEVQNEFGLDRHTAEEIRSIINERRLNLREGQYVQWDWSTGTAYGQVDEIVDDGSRTVDGNTREVSADEDEQIAVIDQYSQEGEPQDQRVLKLVRPGDDDNENNLRGWDAPSKARNNNTRFNLREGQYVQWDWSGGTSYGQVEEIVDDGSRSAGGNQRSVSADDDEQIAVISHLSQDGEDQNQRVVKYVRPGDEDNENNLRAWDAPSAARENQDLLEFTEGDMARLQALPDVWGRIVHIPDDEPGRVMFDLYDSDQFTMTVGMDDIMPYDGMEEAPMEMEATTNIPSDTERYTLTRAGEYVTWDTGNSRKHGQVTAVADSGCLTVGGRERCVESDSHRMVKVQVYSDDGQPQDQQALKLVRRDAPNEGNLRSWNAPRSARMNSVVRVTNVEAEIGDRTIDLTPPQSVRNAAELGLEKKSELGKGDCGTGVGERRANQIVNGNLGPEDFLTRQNGTPIPAYLESHSEDVNGINDPPTQWSDEVWNGVLSEGDDPGCGPVQYALWGGTSTGRGLDWATDARDELNEALDAADETLNTITVNTVVESEMNENTDSDPATLFQRFLRSLGMTSENAAGAEELMDEVDKDEDTTDVQTDSAGQQTEPDATDTMDNKTNTEPDDGDTSDDTDMKENQLDELSMEQVAAKTAFGITELEEMDDQMLVALERTVQEMSGAEMMDEMEEAEAAGSEEAAGYHGGEGEEGAGGRMNTDEETDDTMTEEEQTGGESTDFLTAEEAQEQFASQETVENISESVEDIASMVENIQSEQASNEKEDKARMVANAIEGMSVEAAKALPQDELDNLAETHATRTNYGAVPGSMNRQVTTNTASEEDIEDYPAGGRSNWEQSKAEGGD